MAAKPSFLHRFRSIRPWQGVAAASLALSLSLALAAAGAVHAANNSVQGAKKEDNAFDGDAPTAILMEATSGSILFEKNADELRAPSSMMKLMTAEVIFNALKEGKIKLTDEFRISENAWRKGGAPSGGSTMFAAINSKVSVDDLLHGAIIQSGNDACIALAEGMAGSEKKFANDFMTSPMTGFFSCARPGLAPPTITSAAPRMHAASVLAVYFMVIFAGCQVIMVSVGQFVSWLVDHLMD